VMNGSGRVRFGAFEFDTTTGELRREGHVVKLQPQPARVLALLVASAGDVVTRETLRDAIWGGDTFVDFDRGLNFCIAQIRSALGDTPETPQFIRTLPKRGYQFIAAIDPAASIGEDAKRVASSVVVTPRLVSRVSRRFVAIAAGIALCAAVAGGAWWKLGAPAALPPDTRIAVAVFDNETDAPELGRFTQGLTDTVIAQLAEAGAGQYEVIGNAAILRSPRPQRDLKEINATLGASYVVLGQVQRDGTHIRVLAHLIHLPEQTHVWVTRLDRQSDDPLGVQLDMARTIASDFTRRLVSAHRLEPFRTRKAGD
jgi:DNA-binding winged helix-turn-helix (wHTH) protein/TolB-like protein